MKSRGIILIVEDEALIAMDLKKKLGDAGYSVCRLIATGEDAVLWAERDRPDLILMDNRLSGKIDGIEAALRIRAQSEVRIIIMSGYPQDEEFQARVKPFNPVACLAKPLAFEELLTILKSIFGD